MKELVREKKHNLWREVVFDGNKKEFWAFVGRRTKGKRKKNIRSLKSEPGVSVTSTRGELEVLQRHYQQLGKLSLDSNFDAEWKQEVVSNVSRYGSMSELCEDEFLDKEIEKGVIVKCIRKLKNNKTGGTDGLVGELLKYGGSGMVYLLEQLLSVIWRKEIVPKQWREGLIIKKGDREDPGNYRGITY